MNIRYAIKKDYLGVENIMQQVQTMHVFWSPDIYQKVDIAMPKETFEILVFKKQLIVAEDENHQILGIVSFEEKQKQAIHLVKRNIIYIHVIAIDEKYRGQGIGRQLLDFMKKMAKDKHYDGLELSVNVHNQKAKSMYENYGFEEKSIHMNLKL